MAPRRRRTPQQRAQGRAERLAARLGPGFSLPAGFFRSPSQTRGFVQAAQREGLFPRAQSRAAQRRARIEARTGIQLRPGQRAGFFEGAQATLTGRIRSRAAGRRFDAGSRSAAPARGQNRPSPEARAQGRAERLAARLGPGFSLPSGFFSSPAQTRDFVQALQREGLLPRAQSRGAQRRQRIAERSSNRLVLRPGQNFAQEVGRAVQRGARQRTASPAAAGRSPAGGSGLAAGGELLQGPLPRSGRRANTQEAAQRSLRRSEASRGAERDRGSSRRTNQRNARTAGAVASGVTALANRPRRATPRFVQRAVAERVAQSRR